MSFDRVAKEWVYGSWAGGAQFAWTYNLINSLLGDPFEDSQVPQRKTLVA